MPLSITNQEDEATNALGKLTSGNINENDEENKVKTTNAWSNHEPQTNTHKSKLLDKLEKAKTISKSPRALKVPEVPKKVKEKSSGEEKSEWEQILKSPREGGGNKAKRDSLKMKKFIPKCRKRNSQTDNLTHLLNFKGRKTKDALDCRNVLKQDKKPEFNLLSLKRQLQGIPYNKKESNQLAELLKESDDRPIFLPNEKNDTKEEERMEAPIIQIISPPSEYPEVLISPIQPIKEEKTGMSWEELISPPKGLKLDLGLCLGKDNANIKEEANMEDEIIPKTNIPEEVAYPPLFSLKPQMEIPIKFVNEDGKQENSLLIFGSKQELPIINRKKYHKQKSKDIFRSNSPNPTRSNQKLYLKQRKKIKELQEKFTKNKLIIPKHEEVEPEKIPLSKLMRKGLQKNKLVGSQFSPNPIQIFSEFDISTNLEEIKEAEEVKEKENTLFHSQITKVKEGMSHPKIIPCDNKNYDWNKFGSNEEVIKSRAQTPNFRNEEKTYGRSFFSKASPSSFKGTSIVNSSNASVS